MSAVADAARLSDDAATIVLLCATLGRRASNELSPLSTAEYDTLTSVLRARALRPSALLRLDARELSALLADIPAKAQAKVSPDRVQRLLDRGGHLALASTKWSSAGIWIVTRADAAYPTRYKHKLGRGAPPVVFGIGSRALLEMGGLAVVGSRDPDPMSIDVTRRVGAWAAGANVQIVSGAARGVDSLTMLSCVDNGGTALGIVADSLLRLSTKREFRESIVADRLTLISSYDPEAGFTVATAMGRNRWIYALADRALVVACSEGSGGTWAGAIEALKRRAMVFVQTGNPDRPGNDALLRYGAIPAPARYDDMLHHEAPAFAGVPPEPTVSATPPDLFAVVRPYLLAFLADGASAQDVASALDLEPQQVTTWLARLLELREITKIGSRYRAAAITTLAEENGNTTQLPLIGE